MSRATRVTRGARQDDPKPSRRQETLKVTSERAQQARRRAQQCFLSLIEGPVEPRVFIATARYINPEVYDDVVVERAVAGLCGYPMCPNAFTDTYGSRTYIIRNNKLYDITERRNFCSNVCFEASELVRKQVLTLPLYLRDTQDSDMKDVRLPSLSRLNGRHGKLVDITGGISKLELNEDEKPRSRRVAFMSVDDIARESLVNWSENEADKEQTESGTEVIDISDVNQAAVPPENTETNQSKASVKSNDLNQNRIAEETSQEGKNSDDMKDIDIASQNRVIPEKDDISQRKPATQGNDPGENPTITEKTVSSVTHEECSFLASSSGNQQHEVDHLKEVFGGQGDSDAERQSTEEENLNKEDSGYESTKEKREQSKDICNSFPEESVQQKDRCDSKLNFLMRVNKEEVRDRGGQVGSVCDKINRNSEESKECTKDNGAWEEVPARSDQNHKSGTADAGASKHKSSEDPSGKAIVEDTYAEVHKVEAMMRQWVSFDSLRVVLGDLYVRGMLEHLGRSWDNYDTTSGLRLSVEAKSRYISLCRRLDHEEKQEEVEGLREGQDRPDLNHEKQCRPNRPLPDYSQLQRQAEKQQLKVVSFLGGSDQYEEPVEEGKLESIPEEESEKSKTSSKRKLKSKKQSESSDTRDPTLPFVDSYSQVAWRQSIVVEKVTAYLQQMLEMTKLSVHEVKKLLGPLVATFHLSPDNISFRPKQWRLVTLILLKMLSVRYPAIQDALRTEEGLSMQRTILFAFSLDLGYCDRVLSYLTEIKHILRKGFKVKNTVDASQGGQVLQKQFPEGQVRN